MKQRLFKEMQAGRIKTTWDLSDVLDERFMIFGDRVTSIGFERDFPWGKHNFPNIAVMVENLPYLGLDFGTWQCTAYRKGAQCSRKDYWYDHAVWKVGEEDYEAFLARQERWKENCRQKREAMEKEETEW